MKDVYSDFLGASSSIYVIFREEKEKSFQNSHYLLIKEVAIGNAQMIRTKIFTSESNSLDIDLVRFLSFPESCLFSWRLSIVICNIKTAHAQRHDKVILFAMKENLSVLRTRSHLPADYIHYLSTMLGLSVILIPSWSLISKIWLYTVLRRGSSKWPIMRLPIGISDKHSIFNNFASLEARLEEMWVLLELKLCHEHENHRFGLQITNYPTLRTLWSVNKTVFTVCFSFSKNSWMRIEMFKHLKITNKSN